MISLRLGHEVFRAVSIALVASALAVVCPLAEPAHAQSVQREAPPVDPGRAPAPKPAREAPDGESDCALEVARRVQAHYDRISDFEAKFEQVTKSLALGEGSAAGEPARGKVVMAKPGKMRWEYTEPQESQVLSDGVNLWIYDVAAKEVQHMVASGGYLSGAALQFLMGRGLITEEFVVTSERCSEGLEIVDLELTPRRPGSYERLALRVVRATGEVQATTLFDLFGNVTTISFRAVRVDLAPPPATFQFELPPGVELIELTPPQ